jgi:hypothetical protein
MGAMHSWLHVRFSFARLTGIEGIIWRQPNGKKNTHTIDFNLRVLASSKKKKVEACAPRGKMRRTYLKFPKGSPSGYRGCWGW